MGGLQQGFFGKGATSGAAPLPKNPRVRRKPSKTVHPSSPLKLPIRLFFGDALAGHGPKIANISGLPYRSFSGIRRYLCDNLNNSRVKQKCEWKKIRDSEISLQ
jgi:hypothetical protein